MLKRSGEINNWFLITTTDEMEENVQRAPFDAEKHLNDFQIS